MISEYKTIGLSIAVKIPEQPKTYGAVHRGGKTHYRNYRRPLKNKKGLSLVDIFIIRGIQAEQEAIDALSEALFTSPLSTEPSGETRRGMGCHGLARGRGDNPKMHLIRNGCARAAYVPFRDGDYA